MAVVVVARELLEGRLGVEKHPTHERLQRIQQGTPYMQPRQGAQNAFPGYTQLALWSQQGTKSPARTSSSPIDPDPQFPCDMYQMHISWRCCS